MNFSLFSWWRISVWKRYWHHRTSHFFSFNWWRWLASFMSSTAFL